MRFTKTECCLSVFSFDFGDSKLTRPRQANFWWPRWRYLSNRPRQKRAVASFWSGQSEEGSVSWLSTRWHWGCDVLSLWCRVCGVSGCIILRLVQQYFDSRSAWVEAICPEKTEVINVMPFRLQVLLSHVLSPGSLLTLLRPIGSGLCKHHRPTQYLFMSQAGFSMSYCSCSCQQRLPQPVTGWTIFQFFLFWPTSDCFALFWRLALFTVLHIGLNSIY